jgi:hypothetical protein
MTLGLRTRPATGATVANDVEGQVLVERRVDAVRRVHEQHRVAVGRRLDRELGADVVAAAGLVLDTNVWPIFSVSHCAMIRASTSVGCRRAD